MTHKQSGSIRRSALLSPDRTRVVMLTLLALIGWLSLILIIMNADPGETARLQAVHTLNRLLFFASLFTGLFGTASLIAYIMTHRIYPLRRDRGDLIRALQEGVAISVMFITLAILRTVDMLTWLSAALVIIAGLVAFTFALTRK